MSLSPWWTLQRYLSLCLSNVLIDTRGQQRRLRWTLRPLPLQDLQTCIHVLPRDSKATSYIHRIYIYIYEWMRCMTGEQICQQPFSTVLLPWEQTGYYHPTKLLMSTSIHSKLFPYISHRHNGIGETLSESTVCPKPGNEGDHFSIIWWHEAFSWFRIQKELSSNIPFALYEAW